MIELLLITALTIFLTWFLFKYAGKAREIEEVEITTSLFDEPYFISVIVPIRNEEENVERCITSLMNQNYPSYEVIAVDDLSTDNTPSILEDLLDKYSNLRVIRGFPKPEGWVGKTHALWQGFRVAEGNWLLFIDADTCSSPSMIRSAVSYAVKHKVDMLSLIPFQELDTFWERVTQPIIFASVATAFPYDKVNNPNLKEAFAIGQFILVSRNAYEAIGGHESVRDKIVEDVALAKLVKGNGYRVRVASGRRIIKTRMYKSLHEIWEGWTKNVFLGIEKNRRNLAQYILILSLLGYLPIYLLVKYSFGFSLSQGLVYSVILIESSWVVFLSMYMARESAKTYDIPAYYAVLYPFSIGIFIGIMLSSAYKVVSGKGVTWKKRRYLERTNI
jgi:chlorobactene glucosyltransferase